MERSRFLHLVPVTASAFAIGVGDNLLREPEQNSGIYRLSRLPTSFDEVKRMCEQAASESFIESTGRLRWPVVRYEVISKYFTREHTGVDIVGNFGTTIVAVDGGKVIGRLQSSEGYGEHILISHGSGRVTLYAHLLDIAIREQQLLKKGDVIGRLGSSGNSTGPHLHFEILEYQEGQCWSVNPLLRTRPSARWAR